MLIPTLPSCQLYRFHLHIKLKVFLLENLSCVQGNSRKQLHIFSLVTNLAWVESSNVSTGMTFVPALKCDEFLWSSQWLMVSKKFASAKLMILIFIYLNIYKKRLQAKNSSRCTGWNCSLIMLRMANEEYYYCVLPDIGRTWWDTCTLNMEINKLLLQFCGVWCSMSNELTYFTVYLGTNYIQQYFNYNYYMHCFLRGRSC